MLTTLTARFDKATKSPDGSFFVTRTRSIYTCVFKNSFHRSVFIHCSQFYNYTANYGRPLILLKTHVVLVACGSNIRVRVPDVKRLHQDFSPSLAEFDPAKRANECMRFCVSKTRAVLLVQQMDRTACWSRSATPLLQRVTGVANIKSSG